MSAPLSQQLHRWQQFAAQYRLPEWETIPQFGLYMDQVMVLLQQYLAFLPASGGKDSFLTPATVNNYVRLKLMPPPEKRKYSRTHIAYLLMILTLKMSLRISDIQRLLPPDLDEAAMETMYRDYCGQFSDAARRFSQRLERTAGEAEEAAQPLVVEHALTAAFHALLAQQLLEES